MSKKKGVVAMRFRVFSGRSFVLSIADISAIKKGWDNFVDTRNQIARLMTSPFCLIIENCEEHEALVMSQILFEKLGKGSRPCCYYNPAVKLLSLYCDDDDGSGEVLEEMGDVVIAHYGETGVKRVD